ncbi:hypothetical protein P343_00020 [Sporolactobacillus laevolacticus DSM 442]|uniref:Uncharacterized protein n=1 Tax=Sporolactobacillus laevolacticus DSM 442 TaxID=1395513 RepID=V6J1E2_9BACL|nr:hypothetical protein P343_00020 [Sporolactobacillus laevolacticus DSM 442]
MLPATEVSSKHKFGELKPHKSDSQGLGLHGFSECNDFMHSVTTAQSKPVPTE